MRIFLITGKPACGKDTQANFIAKKFNAKKIITSKIVGDFLEKTKLKTLKIGGAVLNLEKQRKIPKQGKLWHPKLVAFVLSKELINAIKNKKSLVISGSPRTLAEAKTYLGILKQHLKKEEFYCRNRFIDFGNNKLVFSFINLRISDKEAIKRALLRKRSVEDTAEIIKERLNAFKKQILPAIFYLKNQKALLEINGEQNRKAIFQEICKKVL